MDLKRKYNKGARWTFERERERETKTTQHYPPKDKTMNPNKQTAMTRDKTIYKTYKIQDTREKTRETPTWYILGAKSLGQGGLQGVESPR